mgnify:CR=1 FL=1
MSANEIEFYDVKEKARVKVQLDKCTKTTYERKLKSGKTQTRYAFKGQTSDGRNLTKFCNQKDWEAAKIQQT